MASSNHHSKFEPKTPHQHKPLVFPKDFLWGAATSSHQIEGWNDNNDWWQWEHQPGTIADGQLSGRGPDHYHRYEEDFGYLERMNLQAYRMSLEWSRIQPKEDGFSMKAVDHYKRVLEDLKRRDIKVMLTLHHFTNPIWFAEKGAFEKRKNIQYYLEYVDLCAREFGEYVDQWVTINEANVYTMLSYILGVWPPGKTSYWSAYRVFHHLSIAHRRAYEIIKDYSDKPVGIAHNVMSFDIYNRHSFKDWMAVKFTDWLWNHWFFEKTGKTHDFLGVNYYMHKRVEGFNLKNWDDLIDDNQGEGRERTDLEWEIHPPGFFDAMVNMGNYNLPIYVTENGISTLNDDQRARFIVSYLKELYHATQSGIDVRGYYYWSLLDNFEWDKGYKSRFGLVEVDYRTLKRRLRGSGKLYGLIAGKNAIEHDLLSFVGHGIDPDEFLEER